MTSLLFLQCSISHCCTLQISREEVDRHEVVHVNFSVVRIRNKCASPEPYNHEFNMHGTQEPVFLRVFMTHEEAEPPGLLRCTMV